MIRIGLKRPAPPESALVIIMRPDGRVLVLLRPSWIGWAPNTWAYPGGGIEEGETPLAAAIREVKEETNLDVTNLKKVKYSAGQRVEVYFTKEYNGQVQIDWENDAWRWASGEELSRLDLAPDVLEMYNKVLKT
tara:strand:- start:649 stop:1050 length:402 start_codon:yes stop_codon:yes gene_type:complete